MTEFPRVGLFSKGYDCAQVDAFFEDARRAYEGGVPRSSSAPSRCVWPLLS